MRRKCKKIIVDVEEVIRWNDDVIAHCWDGIPRPIVQLPDMVVYSLEEPDSAVVRYVGVTQDLHRRLKLHFQGTTRSTAPWISSLAIRGLIPRLRILSRVRWSEALTVEKEMIQKFSVTGNLLNVTHNSQKGRG